MESMSQWLLFQNGHSQDTDLLTVAEKQKPSALSQEKPTAVEVPKTKKKKVRPRKIRPPQRPLSELLLELSLTPETVALAVEGMVITETPPQPASLVRGDYEDPAAAEARRAEVLARRDMIQSRRQAERDVKKRNKKRRGLNEKQLLLLHDEEVRPTEDALLPFEDPEIDLRRYEISVRIIGAPMVRTANGRHRTKIGTGTYFFRKVEIDNVTWLFTRWPKLGRCEYGLPQKEWESMTGQFSGVSVTISGL